MNWTDSRLHWKELAPIMIQVFLDHAESLEKAAYNTQYPKVAEYWLSEAMKWEATAKFYQEWFDNCKTRVDHEEVVRFMNHLQWRCIIAS